MAHIWNSYRARTSALMSGLLVPVIALAQALTDAQLCGPGGAGQDKIAACTRVINSRTPPKLELAGSLFQRGREWQLSGNVDQAVADYDESIRLDPRNAFAFLNRGVARRDHGDNEKAIPDFNEAIRLDPGFARAFYNRGTSWLIMRENDKAITEGCAPMIGNGRSGMNDNEIRQCLNRHWAASDTNDFDSEHEIYRDDALLEYPQSGERIRGRHNIQASREVQPNAKRFKVQRILGTGGLWVTQLVLAYDRQPSYSVSIMEFQDGKVVRETQYFAAPFEPGPSRTRWVEPIG